MANDARKRVLIVDDASLVRLYYRTTLENAGLVVGEALNGIEALEQLLTVRYDLLVVDVNMPQMDGITFVKSLRGKSAPMASTPVLMSSSEAHAMRIAAARAAGANFYIVKPLTQEALVQYALLLCGAPHG
ncbi:MAG: response regulator [Gammaproteobacteria bacterium]